MYATMNSEAAISLGADLNIEVGGSTPEPDPALTEMDADVCSLVKYLQQQLDIKVEERRNDVSHTVDTAVKAALNIIREDFDDVVDSTLSRTLENATMLALVTETI